ncbi:MAG: sigma-70 family RNA polymerase sigma factor, partial [Ignavibacteria bacterium]|nr:sigma-70 family RNA polymerase sigma factor [Ignavibacteria bacterium]
LYRIARSYGIEDDVCEDMLQQTYINVYSKLNQFEGRSLFSTWLIRILINECLMYKRQNHKFIIKEDVTSPSDLHQNPESIFMEKETSKYLESAISSLPENYSTVFVMRELEGMNTNEVAEILNISNVNVKIRLHRAKQFLLKYLTANLSKEDIYPFGNERCDRVTENVMTILFNQNIPS